MCLFCQNDLQKLKLIAGLCDKMQSMLSDVLLRQALLVLVCVYYPQKCVRFPTKFYLLSFTNAEIGEDLTWEYQKETSF